MVTKRKVWYRTKLINVFSGVTIWEKDDYCVFMSVKKKMHYADKKPVKRKRTTNKLCGE